MDLSEPKTWLRILLVVVGIVFAAIWSRSLTERAQWRLPRFYYLFVGFITNFFDTLGVGSYATTAALYRLKGEVADEHLPGTLNIGHCLPIIVQAYYFMDIVKIDAWTLVSMIVAAVLGAWLGAGFVVRFPRRWIQIGLGTALLVAAIVFVGQLLNFLPGGGTGLILRGIPLAIGLAGSFILGALMMIGFGSYAPTMIMVSLLGMNPKSAFPIMMGSCAFLAPTGGVRFLAKNKYDAAAALGLTLGGIPAVFLAAQLLEKIPLYAIRWMVVVVVLYASIGLLRAAWRSRPQGALAAETQAADLAIGD